MSPHKAPETVAEQLAVHLEEKYGLQLDPARHELLISVLGPIIHFDEIPGLAAKTADDGTVQLPELVFRFMNQKPEPMPLQAPEETSAV